jgi:putative flavoprotein involved in K+ transport
LIVDAHPRIGDSWRHRYGSLTLFTPRQFSTLPGAPVAGNREQYPNRDEFAGYLEDYATRLRLPVRPSTRVTRLMQVDGGVLAETEKGETIKASDAIIATGGFQRPVVPAGLADGFGSKVLQLTPESYLNPTDLPERDVLVVGDGASGRDIALECQRFRSTVLCCGKRRKLFPERLLGKSIWWWLKIVGVLEAPADSWLGRKVRTADAFPDRGKDNTDLMRAGVRLVPRLVSASGTGARFLDGGAADVRTVVWAIGYRDETAWVDIPSALAADGSFSHMRGISPVEGLYYVGRPWQRNRALALVMGVGPDAQVIVGEIRHRHSWDGSARP